MNCHFSITVVLSENIPNLGRQDEMSGVSQVGSVRTDAMSPPTICDIPTDPNHIPTRVACSSRVCLWENRVSFRLAFGEGHTDHMPVTLPRIGTIPDSAQPGS